MSIRSAIVVVGAIGLAAAFVQAAHADVTFKSQDGAFEITLPNGWHEAKQSGSEAKIHVAGQGTRVTVREHAKEDFKDIKAVATFLADRLKKRFTDAEPKFEDVQVNGKPAVRMELEGTEPSGVRVGYLITVIDSDKAFISIMGTGNASAFTKHKQLLADLAGQLKVTAASAATPPAATPPTATPSVATPPAATPPAPAAPATAAKRK
jgi:predicted RNA binding protein YcfA (HicA-like mRNA interferase family)